MKSKYTPGPWKTIKPGHGQETKYLCVQIGEDENYTTLELLPADARLIAAAPYLLAACKKAIAGVLDPEARKLIKAAIAQAEQ